MKWEKEQDAEIYYDKEAAEKITKGVSSYIINQLKDIMEKDNRLIRKKLALSKIHFEGGVPDVIITALIRLGMKDLTQRDNHLENSATKPYLFIYSGGYFLTSGDWHAYDASELREMTAQELYSILFAGHESSDSNEKWAFEGGKKEAPFYMVYVEGASSPTKKHRTLESAEAEAERLSKLTDQKVYVLSACMELEAEQIVHKTSIEDMDSF